jgi:DNA-binding MarR family transcriptional regulator
VSPRYRVPPGNTDLDPFLLDPTRLGIVALLASAQWCEFAFVRDSVQLTDPALSKQVGTLAARDYVQVRKGYVGKVPRTWLRATTRGRRQLEQHLNALRAIADQARAAGAEHHTGERHTDERHTDERHTDAAL